MPTREFAHYRRAKFINTLGVGYWLVMRGRGYEKPGWYVCYRGSWVVSQGEKRLVVALWKAWQSVRAMRSDHV